VIRNRGRIRQPIQLLETHPKGLRESVGKRGRRIMQPPTVPQIEPLYTDAQVAEMLDPTGTHIKPRSIRSERENGRLIGTKVAGKWLYRGSDVAAFLNNARETPPWPAPIPDRASFQSANPDGRDPSSTSAGPSEEKSASGRRLTQPAMLGALRHSSKRASPKDDAPHEPAQVIPIKFE
jgi:hypothetical protein